MRNLVPQAQVKEHRLCQKRLPEKGCVGFSDRPVVLIDLIVSVSLTFFSLQRACWLLHQSCFLVFIYISQVLHQHMLGV